MPRTAVPVSNLPGSVSGAYLNASHVDADSTNDHEWVQSSGDMLVCFNTGVTSRIVAMSGPVNWGQNRSTVAVVNASLGAGQLCVFGPLPLDGFVNAGADQGKAVMTTNDTAGETKFAVLRGAK